MPFFVRRIAALLALGFTLASCGGGGGTTSASTPVPAPAPIPVPPPEQNWRPIDAFLPASGNYIYIDSDQGDYISAGKSYTYTDQNALLSVTASGTSVKMVVKAIEKWDGQIILPAALPSLQVGLYEKFTQLGNNPANGQFYWAGEGRACNTAYGWVAIDKATIVAGVVTELDLRFEQHCASFLAATRGKLHWTLANAKAVVPASPSPIPPALWRAESTAVPASGSYVYLNGVQDKHGAIHNRLYTRSNAIMWLSSFEGHMRLDIKGDQQWTADFSSMAAVKKLEPGYYPKLAADVIHNPLFGGLSWSGESVACFGMESWVVIDAVTYAGNEIATLDMRFERSCTGGVFPMRGQVHWQAGETPVIVGPAVVPSSLWKPPSTFVAPSGSYMYVSSETGFYLKPFSATTALDTLNYLSENRIPPVAFLDARAGEFRLWFTGIDGLPVLSPGYYAGLKDPTIANPTKGSFELTGNGTTCFHSQSWVAVDQASYTGNELTAIDLRFETTCEGSLDVIHGKIHWVKPL